MFANWESRRRTIETNGVLPRERNNIRSSSLDCYHVIVRHTHLLQSIRSHVYQMGSLYTYLKVYRAAFFAYRISLFSTVSSLAGLITPQFFLPQQNTENYKRLAEEAMTHGTKLSPTIRPGFDSIYYKKHHVLEVPFIPCAISVILGTLMNSNSWTFDIYHSTQLYQPIMTGEQPTCTHSQILFSQNPLITRGLLRLERTLCYSFLGTTKWKSAENVFSRTTDETLICLSSLFYNYDIPALRNCQIVSVLLPDAPWAIYLADGLSHIISNQKWEPNTWPFFHPVPGFCDATQL